MDFSGGHWLVLPTASFPQFDYMKFPLRHPRRPSGCNFSCVRFLQNPGTDLFVGPDLANRPMDFLEGGLKHFKWRERDP